MKIPEHAKKVFEGVIFDIYQWEQELFDGTSTTFEVAKRPSTAETIPILESGEILISHEQQPHMDGPRYSLFSGRFEPGEKPLEVAQRELLEESGLESSNWELLRQYDPVTKLDWTIYVFVARGCKKVAETQLEPGERITPHSCDFDEFTEKATSTDFWSREFSNDLYRIKHEGKLDEFKEKLFKA